MMPGLQSGILRNERLQLNRNYGITKDPTRLNLLKERVHPNSMRRYDWFKVRSTWLMSFKCSI